MRLKEDCGTDTMSSSLRPTVKPRTKLPGGPPAIQISSTSETLSPLENSSVPKIDNSEVHFKLVPRKPRPKPRLTPTEEASEEDDTLPECFKEPPAKKDPKRTTINIFKRPIVNPFDADFEESIKDAALTTVDSDDSSPEQERSSFFDTESDSHGDDAAVEYEKVVPRSEKRLVKMDSCPGAPESSKYEHLKGPRRSEPRSESIYETISSYSSSESGLSDPNENPQINWANFTKQSESVTDVTSKRLSGGTSPISKSFNSISSPAGKSLNFDDTRMSTRIEEKYNSLGSLNGSTTTIEKSETIVSEQTVTKPKNEYDEVAVEDGFVKVNIPASAAKVSPDTLNVKGNKDSTCLPTRNSVVMEFDPLCQDYEDIDDESEIISGNASISTMDSSEIVMNQRLEVDNPDYFPGNLKEMSSDIKSSTGSFQKISDEDENYEPVYATRPLSSSPRDSNEFSPSKNNSLAGSMEEVSTRSAQKTSDSHSNNFLRRLSNKLLQQKLGAIKEETSVRRGSNESKRGTTESVNSSTTTSMCPRCLSEHTDSARCKFSAVPRENINYSSQLYKASGISKKDFVKRFGVLTKGKITINFPNKPEKITDTIILEKVVMISKKDDHRTSHSSNDLKCFQLYLGNGKHSTVILAGENEKDRSIWMQKLIEAFTYSFPSNIISSYDRAGWCFIKENLTGDWQPSWFVLSERKLYYAFYNSEDNFQLDLRKVREISSSSKDGECPFVENSEVLTIHAITKILYVQTENAKLTTNWEKTIRSAALYNGIRFEDMQLTNDDVPVVVAKCIDFLCPHGTLAEGIYRQSGANTRITGLLESFKKDAWSVQISLSEYSAHDVAGTLKRFFRTLPEPLLTDLLYDRWISAYGQRTRQDKMSEYSKLLSELPQINYNILKKLVCHLHAVHEKREKNLMPLDNLAPIWGPTLMSVDDCVEDTSKLAKSFEIACAQCGVVRDLIENYYILFRVDPQEIEREKRIREGLDKFHLDSVRRKPSGDMRFFVYLHERDENAAINVILTPTATAQSIVERIVSTHCKGSGDNLSLHEVILSKNLERPMFPSEKVVETILRWSIWEEEEKRTNYLILKKNTLYPALLPFTKDPSPVYGEFKYADSKSKSFRKYAFEFSGAKLKHFKDTKTTTELESWKIEDIIWYVGHEAKRTPPTKFSFTFIPRAYDFKRSKEEPYFGNVVSVNTQEDLHKFVAAMIIGENSPY